ncbi:MAG: hypothetical protein JNL90_02210 [Planctomycetes bacterium]|nr:hypothetical protein [Planctomycetota bacterium]
MGLLRSVRVRLFAAVFVVASLLFATQVVREHYPAFALAQHGTLACDEWAGLHPDLFQHDDGHWYANNQVGASLVAAPLLWLASPLLDRLEAIGKRQAAADGEQPARFDSAYARRAAFMAEVRKRGIHLRLGAAAALTAVGVMAPAAALLALLFHAELLRRGVAAGRAAGLALLFPFVTPLLFRSAVLNHNQLEALLCFAAFVLLRPGSGAALSAARLAAGGACAAGTLLFDYSGAVIAAAFGVAVVVDGVRARDGAGGVAGALRRALPFALGALPPLLLLFLTQWAQFGDPFRPAQHWMPDAHWSVAGYRGFALPTADLLWKNLFDPSYGLFAFAPLLLLALLPSRASAASAPAAASSAPAPLVARGERLFVLLFALAFLLFSAANQFSRLQWNTGFRCLAPLVAPLALLASAPLARWPARRVAWLALPCALHSLVLAMARFTPPTAPSGFAESTVARSWLALLERGPQLPWFTVWRQTQPGGGPPWAPFVAPLVLLGTAALLFALWRAGERHAAASAEVRA